MTAFNHALAVSPDSFDLAQLSHSFFIFSSVSLLLQIFIFYSIMSILKVTEMCETLCRKMSTQIFVCRAMLALALLAFHF